MREFLRIALTRAGHEVTVVDSPSTAASEYTARDFDVVITDLKMAGGSGLDVLDGVKSARAHTQVVVVTAFATPETAIAAMKRGAYDYLTKPFKVDEIGVVVERALEKRALLRDNVELRAELQGRFRLDRLVGKSPPMQRMFELVRRVAPAKTSVLIAGESGTGKELVARALHHLSPRADRPFVAVNCGAIPDALLESELFGHVRGAFTGAHADKPGLFSAADGGTLLLDEIGELSPQMQVKLLRVLQERKVKRVGGVTEDEVDVRVVTATNRDLDAEVERGAFRRDLFYRLNVIEVQLPPLRTRREDVPLLVDHFIRKHAAAMGRTLTGIDPDALAALVDYDFPGNVRELENLIERAATLEPTDRITRASLPPLTTRVARTHSGGEGFPDDGVDLERIVADVERDLIARALERAKGVRKTAAKLLGISFRSLRYRLAKLGLDAGADADDDKDNTPT
ncbi:MAG: two component, sigma54 specific, transcriptional regulator, Fis family [Myxococcales bacterium]|nr:two component, sigma54 specific, transcriptional regulator, Fis family [Myxococcales bacterium]